MCLYMSELKRIQQTDLENLEKTLKETETSLSVRDVHVITRFVFRALMRHQVLKKQSEMGLLNQKHAD